MATKAYDFEQYSVIDIEKFIKDEGYQVEETPKGLSVVDTAIFVMYVTIDPGGRMFAQITLGKIKNDEDAQQRKLYQKLIKKFGCEPKHTGIIKDKGKIVIRDFRNKFFMKFV
jgi:hypothetical protein